MLKFIPLYTLLFFLTFHNISAQKVHTHWPDVKPEGSNFKVITLKEHGALVLEKDANPKTSGKNTYSIIHYNVDFSVNKKYTLETDKSLDYTGYDTEQGNIHFLFSSNKKAFLEVIKLDLNLKKLSKFRIETLRGLKGISFKIIEKSLFVKAGTRNSSMVFQTKLNQKLVKGIKVIATISHKNVQFLSLEKQKTNNGILISSQITHLHQKRINFKTFNLNGELELDIDVKGKPYKNLLLGKIAYINRTDLLVIGTFSNLESNQADGFFVSKFSNGKQENIKYYEYYKFQNFLTDLSLNEKAKFNKVNKKLENNHLHKPTFQYQLYIHDIIEQNGSFTIIGEEFESTFLKEIIDETTGMVAPEAFEYHQDKPNFKISKAIMASFDSEGNLVWENTFAFKNLKTYNLDGVLKCKAEGSFLKVLYKNEGIINRKILKNGALIEEASACYNIQKNDLLGLENWYDDYFFAWSYHIKADDKKHQRKDLCFKKIAL